MPQGLAESGCRDRQQRLWDTVDPDVEWMLIGDPRHLQYLVNFWINPISFSVMERAFLLLRRDGPCTLVADNFGIRSRSAEHYADREHVAGWYDHRHSVSNRDNVLLDELAIELSQVSGQGLYESQWVPAGVSAAIPGTATISSELDLNSTLRHLRRSKLPDEVDLLEACARATEAGHDAACREVHSGGTELDVYRAIQSAAVDCLGTAAIVYGDFQANNASKPKAGGLPTRHRLESGELLILDFSVIACGYRSDFTNTLAVSTPTSEQEQIMQTCRIALETGAKSLRAGQAANGIFSIVSDVLEQAGFGSLRHHAGHGLGLGHPEAPILVAESHDVLIEGDVVTLEPGIYAEGIGGVRVEHNFLIEADGSRQLSHHHLGFA